MKSKHKASFSFMEKEVLDLRSDYERRFRNAILSIAKSDPRWMCWVEKNIRPHRKITMAVLLLVESRARALVFRSYQSLRLKSDSILRKDWPFNDDGVLTPG